MADFGFNEGTHHSASGSRMLVCVCVCVCVKFFLLLVIDTMRNSVTVFPLVNYELRSTLVPVCMLKDGACSAGDPVLNLVCALQTEPFRLPSGQARCHLCLGS